MIEKVLFGLLNANAEYKSAIGVDASGNVKVYPTTAPQGVSRPYGTYQYVSRTENHNKDERGPITFNIQIDHWFPDKSPVQIADDVDKACVNALDHYKGTIAGVKVMSIRVMGGGASFDDSTESRRRMSEFTIKIQPG